MFLKMVVQNPWKLFMQAAAEIYLKMKSARNHMTVQNLFWPMPIFSFNYRDNMRFLSKENFIKCFPLRISAFCAKRLNFPHSRVTSTTEA